MVKPFNYKETCKQYKAQVDAQVAGFIVMHPSITFAQTAQLFNCSSATICEIAANAGIRRKHKHTAVALSEVESND